jgi:serine phosphatase RsbU (regulator of sigma subunit)
MKLNRRILIVDDNESIHQDIKRILCPAVEASASESKLDDMESSLFGTASPAPGVAKPSLGPLAEGLVYEIDSAFQGLDGVEKVKAAQAEGRPYSLIFMDMRMPPGIDGLETLCLIWQHDPWAEVVICSAYSDYSWSEVVQKLQKTDRFLFLKKPFETFEIQQMALSLTTKWSMAGELRKHVADLETTVEERTQQLRTQQVKTLEAEKLALEKDLAVTATVQSLFLPKPGLFQTRSLSGIGFYQPAAYCGGDWWWYEVRPDGTVLVLMGDVTGHGPGPAMVTAVMATGYRIIERARSSRDIVKMLEEISSTVFNICKGEYLISMSAVELLPDQSKVRVWSAAGQAVIQVEPDGSVRSHQPGGVHLGSEEMKLGYLETDFRPGSRVFVATDGILELPLADGKMLGLKGVKALLSESASEGIEGVRDRIVARFKALSQGKAAHDDITFACVEHLAPKG